MIVCQWLETVESVSDLRRFWNGRREDFNIYELCCFYDCLPSESATIINNSDYTVSIDILLLGVIADNLTGIAHMFSKKKIKESELILQMFRKNNVNNRKKSMDSFSDLKNRLLSKKK